MTGITKWNDTGNDMFCKSQLITCKRVKECNGVCPFEDALKRADKMQEMNEQHTVDHDRDWIIGCIEHDGFIHTHRFDKANQIIHDALSAEAVQGEWVRKSGYATPGGDPVWVCSKCGKGMHVYGVEHDSYGKDVSDGQWVACPNCGADMRGEEE